MGKTIKAEELGLEIVKTLKIYADDVKINSQEAAIKVAKETVGELKKNSPKNTGRYRKNWTSESYTGGAIIFQKDPTYRLTHLLEKGYAKKNGGRVAPKSHIAPAEEKAIAQYEKELIRGISE